MSMRTPPDARDWANRTYRLHALDWLAGALVEGDPVINRSFPLHSPAASAALANPRAVAEWMDSWANWPEIRGCTLVREPRRWKGVGPQDVPIALHVATAGALSELGACSKDWKFLRECGHSIVAALGAPSNESTEILVGAMRSCLRDLRTMEPSDIDRCLLVAAWLRDHPNSDVFMRQLPIGGVDSKWVERHRRVLSALLKGARDARGLPGGADFGCAHPPVPRDVVFADPALRPHGIRHCLLDLRELDRLWKSSDPQRPRILLVLENKQSLWALPDLPGVVALHGGGYAVDAIDDISWAATIPLIYWGDLDVDGFTILHRLRAHHTSVSSVMMDFRTLQRHLDLAVPDPHDDSEPPACLSADERDAWREIVRRGGIRIEQERLDWTWVCESLDEALAAAHQGAPIPVA